MTAEDNVDELIAQFDLATGEFLKGNAEATAGMWSHRQDVTLANPLACRAWMGAGCCDYAAQRLAGPRWRAC
jgi:hypothetical protein